MLLPSFGLDDPQGLAMRDAWGWPLAIWDVIGAVVAVYYWTLRRNYGSLMEGAQLFQDFRQREQQALELNDTVLQGLVVAKMALDLDQPSKAQRGAGRVDRLGQPDHHRPARQQARHSLDLLRSIPAAAGSLDPSSRRSPTRSPRTRAESAARRAIERTASMTVAVQQRTRPLRVVIIDDTYDLRELLRWP